jgi:tetratricopeptide (TPR) repeat protein
MALEDHEKEVAYGLANFGMTSYDESQSPSSHRQWKDCDFSRYSVGVGNAGPDESCLQNGDAVFQTKRAVFSKEECESLVEEARDAITSGLALEKENSSTQRPNNSQLGEARVSTMPRAREWLKRAMHNELLPLLESRFGCKANDMTLQDALIIGYGYFGTPTQAQPLHRDSSILSLNVALSPSDDYEGGGTYFQGLNHTNGQETIQNQQGHVMCHPGGVMHAGRSIETGQRWVLVLFILSATQPQIARRCHARGLRAKQDGDWASAYQAFHEGLQVAPMDHQLHMDMGSVYASRGDFVEGRRRLALSSHVYQPCYKAAYGLARDLDNKARTRAALRWFEVALARIGDSDLQTNSWEPLRLAGYDARVKAAQCAIALSLRSPRFAKEYAPKIMAWIHISLQKERTNELLLGMLEAAEAL